MEILPIDDTRHCPPWVRISDKPTTRSCRPPFSQSKDKGTFTAKRVYAFRAGVQIYPKSHTVSSISKMLMIPIGTINAALQRNGKTREGYYFKEKLDIMV